MKFSDFKYLATQSFSEWSEDEASRLAAALAYYTIFSVPPLLIIAIAIAAQIFDRSAVQTQLTAQIARLVGETGSEAIAAILENADEPDESTFAAVISIAILLFGASGVFGQLHDALNTIWEVQPAPGRGILGTIKDRFFSFTMVLGVGFLLLVSLVISSALAAVNEFVTGVLPSFVILAQIINFVVSFGVVTVLFALIYKIVPDVKVAWRDVWIGAVVTAFLFTVGKWAIGLYLGNSAPGSTYGAAGSLIVLLLWVYYSAQILFLGAEFTQVYANKYGSRIVADEGAIALSPQARRRQGIPRPANVVREEEKAAEMATAGALAAQAQTPIAVGRVMPNEQLPLRQPMGELPPSLQPAQQWMKTFHHYVVLTLAFVVTGWRFLMRSS